MVKKAGIGLRRAERRNVKVLVALDSGSKTPLSGHILCTKDVSAGGVYINTDTPLPVGTRVMIKMALPRGQHHSEWGMVWRKDERGMAVRFDNLSETVKKALLPS